MAGRIRNSQRWREHKWAFFSRGRLGFLALPGRFVCLCVSVWVGVCTRRRRSISTCQFACLLVSFSQKSISVLPTHFSRAASPTPSYSQGPSTPSLRPLHPFLRPQTPLPKAFSRHGFRRGAESEVFARSAPAAVAPCVTLEPWD